MTHEFRSKYHSLVDIYEKLSPPKKIFPVAGLFPVKHAAEGRTLAVLVAMRSHILLDRNALPTGALVPHGDENGEAATIGGVFQWIAQRELLTAS